LSAQSQRKRVVEQLQWLQMIKRTVVYRNITVHDQAA
jgi:hypothetical protein